MIFKILINKQGGSVAVLDYMCNERINNNTAKVLKGNEKLTRAILKSLDFNQKLFVCVLSFEEFAEDICNDTKTVIMNSFERTLLPNLDRRRYNILWIEHSDKKRLELNCVITQVDLLTQKSLTVYLDSLDRCRMSLWQDIQNYIHDLSDPKDPRKKQSFANDKRIGLFDDYSKLNDKLHQLVEENKIINRSHMINLLHHNNIETKAFKTFIKVKFQMSKRFIKLHGDIYSENFISRDALEEISQKRKEEIEAYESRDKRNIYKRKKVLLEKQLKIKERQLKEKYSNCK